MPQLKCSVRIWNKFSS